MKTVFTLLCSCSIQFLMAQYNGLLDYSYSDDGKVNFATQPNENVVGLALQSGGKAVVLSNSGDGAQSIMTVLRFNTDGTPDLSFGTNGTTTLPISDSMFPIAISLDVLPNDLLLVGFAASGIDGSLNDGCFRLLPDGQKDLTFGTEGYFIYDVTAPSIIGGVVGSVFQPDGKALIYGTTFNNYNGKIKLKRIKVDGTPDSTFGINSLVAFDNSLNTDVPKSVSFTSDDKIVVAGLAIIPTGTLFDPAYDDIAIARFHMDGSPDSSFSLNGRFTTNLNDVGDALTDVILLPDGSLFAGGYIGDATPDVYTDGTTDFLLCKFTESGELDPAFGNNGYLQYDLGASSDWMARMELDQEGRIVMAGTRGFYGTYDDYAMIRVNQDGTLDNTFGNNGIVITDLFGSLDNMVEVKIQTDGKILTAGITNHNGDVQIGLARYWGDSFENVDEFDNTSVMIFPNPAQDKIWIKNKSGKPPQKMMVINAIGETVLRCNSTQQNHLNIESLPTGIYHLIIYDKQDQLIGTAPFVKT